MCGIVGYVGKKQVVLVVLGGLLLHPRLIPNAQ